MAATGRRYGVKQSDLYNPTEIAEELTKDVMDSSFLSAKAKTEYSERLKGAWALPPSEFGLVEVAEKTTPAMFEHSQVVFFISLVLGLMSFMMTLVVALQAKESITKDLPNNLRLLLPTLTAILAMVIAMASSVLYREIKKRTTDSPKKTEITAAEPVNRKDESKTV